MVKGDEIGRKYYIDRHGCHDSGTGSRKSGWILQHLSNSRLTHERHIESYAHAMRHIKNGDFEKQDVNQIELEAHDMEIAKELCSA